MLKTQGRDDGQLAANTALSKDRALTYNERSAQQSS